MTENGYIARAADHLRCAKAANTEQERQTWLALAEGWLLISRYEERLSSQSQAKLPNRKEIRRVVATVLKLPELVRPNTCDRAPTTQPLMRTSASLTLFDAARDA